MPNITKEYDDARFFKWVSGTKRIWSDITNMRSTKDLNNKKMLAKILEEDSRIYYLEIDQFNVSDNTKPVKSSYKNALEAFNNAARYIQSGIDHNNVEELNSAVKYMNMGTDYLKLATEYFNVSKR